MDTTKTIPSMLAHAAEWYPDEDAVVQADGDVRYSFAETDDIARRLATELHDRGVDHGDRIAFLSRNTVEHAISYFGVTAIGAIGAGLHTRESVSTLAERVSKLRPAAIIFDTEYARDLEQLLAETNSVDLCIELGGDDLSQEDAVSFSSLVADASTSTSFSEVAPDDRAYINFTSGTTGEATGIVHTHDEIIENAHLGQYCLQLRPSDTFLNVRSPSFIGWSNWQFSVLNSAASTVFLDGWEPSKVLETIETESITGLALSPTQWKLLLDEADDTPETESVRIAVCAGEPVSRALVSDVREKVTDNVVVVYGSTETMCSGTALFSSDIAEQHDGSIGKPLPNVDVRLIEPGSNDPAATVEDGTVGEVIVRGPSVAESVWPDGDDHDVFHEAGWWFSGDLAQKGEDGFLRIEGRSKHTIVSGGVNIHAENVEQKLESHPSVVEAAVVGIPHEVWNEAIKAYIVPSSETLTEEEIDEWWQTNPEYANYRRPREYEFREKLPQTETGKLDREMLRENS